jgi:hypothetical protein
MAPAVNSMSIAVSDTRSNAHLQLETAARFLGRSAQKWAVFDAVNFGKRRVKTLTEVCARSGLSRKTAATVAQSLVAHHLIERAAGGGEPSYGKIDFFQQNKAKIFKLARLKIDRSGDSRDVRVTVTHSTNKFSVRFITVDEIDSFKKVSAVSSPEDISKMSEKVFKEGVARILGEPGTFTDWGGESNDMWSTRLRLKGRRIVAVFGFKGPGLRVKSALPKHFGKNGDQIQRLFQAAADLYVIQYHRDVNQQVAEMMQIYGQVKALQLRKNIGICLLDGKDSGRIVAAYRSAFEAVEE